MQDPLTSSFRWGETFDTAPYTATSCFDTTSVRTHGLCVRCRTRRHITIAETHVMDAVTFNGDGGVSIVHLSFERGRRLGILLSSDAKDVFRQVRFEVCKSDYLEAFSTLFASRSGVLRG